MERHEFITHLKLLGYGPHDHTKWGKEWNTWVPPHDHLPKVHAAWLNGCKVDGMTGDDAFPTFDQAWDHIWSLTNDQTTNE